MSSVSVLDEIIRSKEQDLLKLQAEIEQWKALREELRAQAEQQPQEQYA